MYYGNPYYGYQDCPSCTGMTPYAGYPYYDPATLPTGMTPYPTASTAPMTIPSVVSPLATTPAQPISPIQPSGAVIPGAEVTGAATPFVEESYIENILRLNLGKIATIYQTFENNTQWNAQVFVGRLEAAGRDHIIISDPQTGKRYLLLMVNLDYITFDEELVYEPPVFPGGIPVRPRPRR